MKRKKPKGLSAGDAYLRRKGIRGPGPESDAAQLDPIERQALAAYRSKRATSIEAAQTSTLERLDAALDQLERVYERDSGYREFLLDEEAHNRQLWSVEPRYRPVRLLEEIARRLDDVTTPSGSNYLGALLDMNDAYRQGGAPSSDQIREAHRLRQTWLRRKRGVPTRQKYREQVRNEPLRADVLRLFHAGETISAIARTVGYGRTRVRTILREELGADTVAARTAQHH